MILQKIREKPSDKVWIKDVSNGRCEVFGNVNSSVNKIASGLSKLGFGKGDVLCMFCSNYVEYWLIALAAWSCGGCVMPVNCELEPEHLEKQLKVTKAKVDIFLYSKIHIKLFWKTFVHLSTFIFGSISVSS